MPVLREGYKAIFLACYAAYALKYPERNKDYIKKAVRKTLACRTEASGCRVYKCPEHPVFRIVPHSRGNRFCAICSSFKTAQWVNEKVVFLASIDTPYCFMTFTVPGTISRIIQENKELLLGEIFHAVSGSLPHWRQKRRNFTPGIVMIPRTSGDRLNYHVHIHLLITCGGLREEKQWIPLNPRKREEPRNGKKYHPAFPPQTISKGFKTLLYRALRRAYRTEGFNVPGEYAESASNFEGFNKLLKAWWKVEWNIDISDPLRNTKEILEYIARYIKKPPISNRRIIEFNETIVKFLAKDRQSKSKKRKEIVAMTTEYFLMCFLEHVPLERFPLIRWYGIFSNRNKKQLMPVVRALIPGKSPAEDSTASVKAVDLWRTLHKENCGIDPLLCPICGRELRLAVVFFPNQLTSLGVSFESIPQFLTN